MQEATLKELTAKFVDHFGREPGKAAFAPGRVEVLGNHTDYNEGFVLSAAIDRETFFVAAGRDDDTCRLLAGDLMEECTFSAAAPAPTEDHPWANYVIGVLAATDAADTAASVIEAEYSARFGTSCDVMVVLPSDGAGMINV